MYGRIGVTAYKDMEGEPKASLTFHVNKIKLHGGIRQEIIQTNKASTVSPNEVNEPLEDSECGCIQFL
jgi:single-strand DNA-binding protein